MCVAAAIAGAGVVGGVASSAIGASASKSAANTQADAARDAAALQQQQYDQTREDLQPYRDVGTNNIAGLQSLANNPFFTQGFYYDKFTAPTAQEAQQTPGYQFTLQQGLKAAQNSASARGLGSSGAALKGAESYATGLADSTYNDVFNRALSGYNANYNTSLGSYTTDQQVLGNQYNRLLGLVNLGQNSAAMTAQAGQAATNGIANSVTSGAAASAAGQVGAANALTGGISTAVNGGTNALLLNTLMKTPTAVPTNTASTLYGQSIGSNPYGFTTG